MLASLRTYKDSGEIERIRHATDASIAAHFAAMHTVKPGITEREISALMQYEWGKRGCERPAYAPIVGSGFDSTVLHYSADSGTMQAGDLVVIDAAGEYSMYASDITRTLPVSGSSLPVSGRFTTSSLGHNRLRLRHSARANPCCAGTSGFSSRCGLQLHQHPWQRSSRRAAGKILYSWAWPLCRIECSRSQ